MLQERAGGICPMGGRAPQMPGHAPCHCRVEGIQRVLHASVHMSMCASQVTDCCTHSCKSPASCRGTNTVVHTAACMHVHLQPYTDTPVQDSAWTMVVVHCQIQHCTEVLLVVWCSCLSSGQQPGLGGGQQAALMQPLSDLYYCLPSCNIWQVV